MRIEPSGAFRLPSPYWLVGLWLLVVGLGWRLVGGNAGAFGLVFFLAGALPALIVLAAGTQWLGFPATWRRVLGAMATGSTLSVVLALVLNAILPFVVLMVAEPLLESVLDALETRDLRTLFFSPAFIAAMVTVAVVAPLVEELVKPLAAVFTVRSLKSPQEAFFLGMAGGAGFAIIETFFYMAAAVWYGDLAWLAVAALRGIGSVLHPFNAGLVALGWYRWRHEGNLRSLLTNYALAVVVHALWNGFWVLTAFTLGAQFYEANTWQLDLYGITLLSIELLFMLTLATVLWAALFLLARHLVGGRPEPLPRLLATPRQLAIWATATAGVLGAIGFLAAPLVRDYAALLLK